MTDKLKYLLLFLFVSLKSIHCFQECQSHTSNTSQYLGTKTPYRLIQNNSRSPYSVPAGCQAVQLWMLVRHGTRYPSSSVILSMRETLPDIRNKILESHSNGIGSLCKDELKLFKSWSAQAELSDEKRLAHEGEDEMADLAERMLERLPGLLNEDYANHTFKFRFTATQRTRKSAKHFADGLFGRKISRYVWYPEPIYKDPILRFYKMCSKWQEEIDDNPETSLIERQAFENTNHFISVRKSVAKKLGLADISPSDLELMYTTCAFETAWDKRSVSPWCTIFNKEEMQVLEYAEDLEYYWNDGYGYDVNYKQACPPIQHMVQSFKIASVKKLPKAIFHFTHSGALLKVLAYLGLYKDTEPLLHSNYEQHRKTRAWRVGRIDSFASNLGAILYRCNNEPQQQVMFLHQENPVKVPGCSESLLCPLDHLLSHHNECHFEKVCSLLDKQDEL